jgi:hypothetical protein
MALTFTLMDGPSKRVSVLGMEGLEPSQREPIAGPGGWGAVLPAKVSRWMLVEDDANRR